MSARSLRYSQRMRNRVTMDSKDSDRLLAEESARGIEMSDVGGAKGPDAAGLQRPAAEYNDKASIALLLLLYTLQVCNANLLFSFVSVRPLSLRGMVEKSSLS
jgi:hypothetical protein